MLSILGFVLGSVFVVGFYGYVFAHLYGEYKKQRVKRADIESHVTVIKAVASQQQVATTDAAPKHQDTSLHHENLLNIAVAAFGLFGLFGELCILNGLLASSH
jgi:hypothetical protein